MRLNEMLESLLSDLFGRMIWRAAAVLVAAVAALAALYQLTVAGTMALEMHYGAMNARLIVAGLYAFATLTTVVVLWATKRKHAANPDNAAGFLSSPRNAQIVMLLEAAMIGFTVGKKTPKSIP